MNPPVQTVKEHYDRFLAKQYAWMAGGFAANVEKNRAFLDGQGIRPSGTGQAIDLGAGCGFVTIPLLEAGFCVTAVDLCKPLLDELRLHAASQGVRTVVGDIMDFSLWAGRGPELIVCMGDTLTHLPDEGAVIGLIRQCHAELVPCGKLILALRDYSREAEGSVVVIPVRRDAGRIFLCRLEYWADHVNVTDVLYSRESGSWERSAGEYRKLRIAPAFLERELERAGFRVEKNTVGEGYITVISEKDA
jgi:SAM-dependent methyltransferase